MQTQISIAVLLDSNGRAALARIGLCMSHSFILRLLRFVYDLEVCHIGIESSQNRLRFQFHNRLLRLLSDFLLCVCAGL